MSSHLNKVINKTPTLGIGMSTERNNTNKLTTSTLQIMYEVGIKHIQDHVRLYSTIEDSIIEDHTG